MQLKVQKQLYPLDTLDANIFEGWGGGMICVACSMRRFFIQPLCATISLMK